MFFMDKSYAILLQFLFIGGAFVTCGTAEPMAQASSKILLNGPWALQSSCEVKAGGDKISASGFKTQGWHRTEVPSTVVAALVADKTYPDPYFGMNLRSFPGVNYRIGAMFSNLQMPGDSPFRCSWWYRTEFTIAPGYKEKTAWLHFDGINYRANVWLNGHQLANAKEMVGTFRAFEFDVSKLVRGGKENALAVEVFAPEKNSLAITWVDWNPAPPDKDMGLWKDVYLSARGPVAVRNPFVSSKLDEDYKSAELTVSADVRNASDHNVEGVVKAEIGSIRLNQPVQLGPSEMKKIRFESGRYPQLKIQNPKLWWPYQMGEHHLYTARLEFESGGRVSDTSTVQFGIREVKSEMTEAGARVFRING